MVLNYIVAFFVSAAVSGMFSLIGISAAANNIKDEKTGNEVCWLILLLCLVVIVAGTILMGKYLP